MNFTLHTETLKVISEHKNNIKVIIDDSKY